MLKKICKFFGKIALGGLLMSGFIFAFDDGFTWNNDIAISNAFFAMNPTNGEIIDALYGDGNLGTDATYYTQMRTGNACNIASMNVVVLSPGTDTIPAILSGNTLYVLNEGTYTINFSTVPKIMLSGDCIGLVGSGNVKIYRPTSSDLFGGSGINNLIFANMTIDGASSSYMGNLVLITGGMNNSFTDLLIKRSYRGIVLKGGGYNYMHNIKGQSFLRYPVWLETSNFNILDHFEFSSNTFGGIRSRFSVKNVFQNGIIYNTTYPYIYTRPCGESAIVFIGYPTPGFNESIHNIQSFNNNTCGMYNQSIYHANINNFVTYNNTRQGLRSYDRGTSNPYGPDSNYLVTNSLIFNNAKDGDLAPSAAGNDLFYDNVISNNGGYGISSITAPNVYFGISTSFDNLSGDMNNTIPGSGDDARIAELGLGTGYLDTGYSMDCSRAVVPLGLNLGTNCTSRSTNLSFTPTYPNVTLFTFGSNVKKQSQPIIWNAANTGLTYGTSFAYDSGLYIGQYVRGGLSGVDYVYVANPVNVSTSISLRHGNAIGTGTYSVWGHGLKHSYSGTMNNTGTLSVDLTDGYGNKAIFVQYQVSNTLSDVYSTYVPLLPPQTDAILNNISISSGTPLVGKDILLSFEYRSTEDASSGYIDFYNSTGLSINLSNNPGWASLGGNMYRYFLGDFSGSVGWNYLYLTATVLADLPEGFTFQTSGYIDNDFVEINPSNNGFSFPFTLENTADLAATGSVNKIYDIFSGDVLTYTVSYANAGPHSANNTTLQVILDAGLEFQTSTPAYSSALWSGTGGTFVVTGDDCYEEFLDYATGVYMDAINDAVVMRYGFPSLYDMLVSRWGFTGTANEAPAYLVYICTDPSKRGYPNMRLCMTNQFSIPFHDSEFSGCGAPFLYLSGTYYFDEWLNETGVYWSGLEDVFIRRGFSSVYDGLVSALGFTGTPDGSAEYVEYYCLDPSFLNYQTLVDCLEGALSMNMDDYFAYTIPIGSIVGYLRNLGTLGSLDDGNIIFSAKVISGADGDILSSPVEIESSTYDHTTGNNQFIFLNQLGVSTPSPVFTPTGGGGGGGTPIEPDNCPDGDFSPSYYDDDCGIIPPPPATGEVHYAPSSGNEMQEAYNYAYQHGITSLAWENARLDEPITRRALAKIITIFAEDVVELMPDTTKVCVFDDITNETPENKAFIKQSCQLGLMGFHQDGVTIKESFEPDRYVTRSQFGTVLSRLLYANSYNISMLSNEERYAKHLLALKKAAIMNNLTHPNDLELRGYVMIMLMRADQNELILVREQIEKVHASGADKPTMFNVIRALLPF